MMRIRAQRLTAGLALTFTLAFVLTLTEPQAQAQNEHPDRAAPAGLARKLGTVKSVSGKTILLTADSGGDFNAMIQDNTRILRIPLGQTDLKNATPIQLQDVQVGDRMLVRGKAGDTPDSIAALQIVVMKQSDVAQKQQQDIQDWQKRGAGGIVSAIDSATGSITVAVTPAVSFVIKTSKSTGFLRYAPSSVKFSDAQKGSFEQIKVGDQLRARGNRSDDGKEIAAEEVISGTFRNIAGTVTAIDAANGTVTVKDILGKKTVVVKVTNESQMRKLPAPMAQRIAVLLKGPAGGQGTPPRGPQTAAAGGAQGQGQGNTGFGGPPRGAAGDFQQMLSRLPAVTLSDLQKEDAVMIVSTAGTSGPEVTAITLLSGVEPILTASPNGMGVAALLSGWNLSAPGGSGGDTAP